jgi:hypothetical protein
MAPNYASPSNAWLTTIWHNMLQCKCQLYKSISTQPSSILCPFKPNYVDKGVMVAKKSGRFQVPSLNQKISKIKSLLCMKKIVTLKPST